MINVNVSLQTAICVLKLQHVMNALTDIIEELMGNVTNAQATVVCAILI